MESLKDVRREIDRIDDELVTLFGRRQSLLGRVAAAKVTSGGPIHDPQREREILARVTAEVPPEYADGARTFFSTLFSISKERQRTLVSEAAPAVRPERVAVVGLGLIGGSFLKAARAAGHDVTALHHGDATGFEAADIVLVCLPPDAVVPWIRAHADRLAPGAIVVDIAGVKRTVLSEMATVPRAGWTFVGGHPMAGREVSGFANAQVDLFRGASMILVPEPATPRATTDRLAAFFRSVGFARTVETTAERHDAMIAFTSQLCHVIATAYARDPLVAETPGFSAGSYADMTRIATQDPAVWSELFLSNADCLLTVLDGFLARLGTFRQALAAGDRERIAAIIDEGAAAKRRENARCSDCSGNGGEGR